MLEEIPRIDWQVFAQFGLGGLILAVFAVLFFIIIRLHAKTVEQIVDDGKSTSEAWRNSFELQNEAWRKTFESYSDRADMRQAETNVVLRDLSVVMNNRNGRAA